MKASGIARFSGSFWAYAPFDTLQVATQLSIWVSNADLAYDFYMRSTDSRTKLFAWDDGTE